MATKLEKMVNELNEHFREALTGAMREKFDIEVEHYFDFFGSMRLITTRSDGEELTAEQMAYLTAYSEGYQEAMGAVQKASRR